MNTSRISRLSLLIGIATVSATSNAGLVAQWDLAGGYVNSVSNGAALTPFGTQAWLTDTVGTTSRQVLELTPGSGPADDPYLTVINPIGGNGGGVRTNIFTIVMDIKVDPTFGDPSFCSLLQTGSSHAFPGALDTTANQNDGDLFIRGDGGFGISGDYEDEDTNNPFRFDYTQWHRVVRTIDCNFAAPNAEYRTYVDGRLQNQVQSPSRIGLDGRHTLNTTQFWLFADEDHEVQKVRVANVKMYDTALTPVEVAALGSLTRTVSGKVNGGFFNRMDVQFRDAGTTTDVGTPKTVAVDASGNYVVSAPGYGNYDMTVKPAGYLRKTVNTNVTSGDVTANLNVVVGDIVNDNVIDLSDYTKLVINFNKLSTDGDWTIPDADGISPSNADLNNDGVVDLSDYTFIVSAFNALGDN